MEASASASFKKQLESVIAVAAGAPKSFGPESYNRRTVTGYEAPREYSFWPVAKFQKEVGMSPSQLSIPTETIQDEAGKDVQGILLRASEDAELKVRVFRRVVGDLESHLSASSSQLREHQATELAKSYEEDFMKVMPAGFSKPNAVLSVENVIGKRHGGPLIFDVWNSQTRSSSKF